MPVQILINLCLAMLWMFLKDEWSLLAFTSGYLVGLFVIFALRRFFPNAFYLKTIWAVFKLFLLFIYELITSSILVVRQIARPKLNITPGIFKIETELEGEWEITLLSLLITLTPGSVVMELSPDGKTLYIHAMDIPESRDIVIKTKNRFEKAIMEVIR